MHRVAPVAVVDQFVFEALAAPATVRHYDESCEPLFLWLKISGRWLTHDVGFHAGQKLRVHVQHGKLTITAA